MPIIPALGRLRWEDHEFEASLSYNIARPCLKEKSKKSKEKKVFLLGVSHTSYLMKN
jgi:hypothetical protein